MKKIKCLLTLAVMFACGICLCACTSGGGTTTTEKPVDYPYMAFFEERVVATQGWKNPVAEEKMDAMVSGEKPFENTVYNGVRFMAKANMNVKSITFTIQAKKDCKILLFANGVKNSTSTSGVSCFLDKTNQNELTTLEAGQTYTFTIFMEAIYDGETLKVGKYMEDYANKEFTIGYLLFKNKDYFENVYYYSTDKEQSAFEEAGVKISKVSFNVEAIK